MNVLWIDDQQDLIDTYRVCLSSLNCKIYSVNDGEKALELINIFDYDLIITDLKMPPGTWGGIWLIEKVRKTLKNKTPILVLSGEGSQTETIKSLRNGADDYILKTNIDKELINQINNLLTSKKNEIQKTAPTIFPIIIAIPFKRIINTSEYPLKLHRILEFFECLVKFCSIIGLSVTDMPINKYLDPRLEDAFYRGPSFGNWNQIRIMLAKQKNIDYSFQMLNKWIEDSMISSIIQIRNDIVHGAEPSSRTAQELCNSYASKIDEVTQRMYYRWDVKIIRISTQKFDGVNYHTEGNLLIGDNPSLPSIVVNSKIPLISDHVYLLLENQHGEQTWHDMFPLIVVDQGLQPSTWNIYLYDCVKCNQSKPLGSDTIQYVDIWSGQRNIIPLSHPRFDNLRTLLFMD